MVFLLFWLLAGDDKIILADFSEAMHSIARDVSFVTHPEANFHYYLRSENLSVCNAVMRLPNVVWQWRLCCREP